ncbi:MAG: DNA-3-methyladenine glycosylase family protein [Acidobacteriota bacterium]
MSTRRPPPYDLEAAVEHLRQSDAGLGALIDRVGSCGLTVHHGLTPFESLLQAVVYQQLHGKAAAAIHARLLALYGRRARPPAVAATSLERLRSVGLSQAKARAVVDLAEKAVAGVVPGRAALVRLADEAIIERLTAVRGVGRWTVEMLLMFTLGRPDVLPAADFGVRKGFALAYRKRRLPTPQELLRHGERWRPYRSVASWYLWRSVELGRAPKRGA